jgi:hypothetical protein
MMQTDNTVNNPVAWLLEPDPANPAVRYFALKDLLDRPEDDPEVRQARAEIMHSGPVPAILAAQHPDGYWAKAGAGYSPKYRATSWQIIFLAELGADPADERVRRGCEYLLSHSMASNGAFTAYQTLDPRGALHCLNGNLIWALLHLGYGDDPRLKGAIDWQVRAITGMGNVTYYESGTSGPGFACGDNQGLPCGWGATKAVKALSEIPPAQRTPAIGRAIETGVEFLLSRDPATASYPYFYKVSPYWFKLGFPLSYWSDVLEIVAILVKLGYEDDPRLSNAIRYIQGKRDPTGRWKLGNALNGKMWVDIEKQGRPSKWVTLRALRVLKALPEA